MQRRPCRASKSLYGGERSFNRLDRDQHAENHPNGRLFVLSLAAPHSVPERIGREAQRRRCVRSHAKRDMISGLVVASQADGAESAFDRWMEQWSCWQGAIAR